MTTQLVSTLKKTKKEQYDKVCDRYNFIEEQDLTDLKLIYFTIYWKDDFLIIVVRPTSIPPTPVWQQC